MSPAAGLFRRVTENFQERRIADVRTKWTEDLLDERLAAPSEALAEDFGKMDGDLMVLGAGGKVGPALCRLARNAVKKSGKERRVIAVSRFGDPQAAKALNGCGVETVRADLLSPGALRSLPDAENVVYMAGKKFNTVGHEAGTWASNAWLSSRVAERYRDSRITVFSTGNIYPLVPVSSGGATEETPPRPVGEYAMSCLARERMFEYAAQAYGTRVAIFRLSYAVDLRYGVLSDLARDILGGRPIPLASPCFNCVWQGYAAEIALRSLLKADGGVFRLNVTGPETVSVRRAAEKLGKLLGREPVFAGGETGTAYLSNAGRMCRIFGYPGVPLETLIEWQAQWIADGGRDLGRPTHFEERGGSY